MPGTQRRDEKYSTTTGVIFLFNLIVGTGALALPGAIQRAGYVVGILLLLVLGLFSFITVSFIIESLAAANALAKLRNESLQIQVEECSDSMEETPLVSQHDSQETNIFEITDRYEIGKMGLMMSPKWCQIVIYFCLCIYLFGDLAIYAVVIGRTCSDIICTNAFNSSASFKASQDTPCWEGYSVTRLGAYRICVLAFIILLGPFVFFNLQKTRFLQFFTSLMRWCAFFIMLIWSMNQLFVGGVQGNPPAANISALPTLFGTLVYSFMCQHSIPCLIQPMKNKKHLNAIVTLDYVLVTVFYLLLSLTAIFAFKELKDIYTLNFWELTCPNGSSFLIFLAYYLALFPVFTLSTNFPIIGITLRNNLRCMILKDAPYSWCCDKLIFPLLTLIPPAALALTVSDVHLLVGVIGSYAGACVQYLIPCLLVISARAQTDELNAINIHASPFGGKFWIFAVYTWMGLSLVFITINYATNWK